MSTVHQGGNLLNQLALEEHDGTLNAHRVVSAATIYAVVNTSAAGQASVAIDGPVAIKGNVTLDPGSRTGILGNVTISDSKGFIGLTTTVIGSAPTIYAVVNTAAAGEASVVIDGPVAIKGNLTLSDSKTFIGLTTTTLGASPAFIGLATTITGAGDRFIGLVTVVQSSIARTITGNVTLSDAKTFIGLTTTTLGASPAFIGLTTTINAASSAFIGIVTVTNRDMTLTGNITISDSKGFIGLVTASSINGGTNKTLLPVTVGLGNNSLSTIAVPTNANSIKVTSILLSSNATTEIAIKSGVSYLYGNASIGITLYPGGGFVLPGSPDSPSILGMPSGSLNLEKRDVGGIVSKVSGGIVYFQE